MLALGYISITALSLVSAILRGYVLSTLWYWFVVPLGLPEIGIALAMGISILASMLTANPFATSNIDKIEGIMKYYTIFVTSTVFTLICWGMGAIISLFL